jgi:hypothetical protein
VKETAVERRLIEKVQGAGGICMKIMPVLGGYPDRLVLLPVGRIFLIETKRPGVTSLRPLQEVFRARAERIGVPVAVLNTSAAVDEWVDARLAEPDDLREELRRFADVTGDQWATATLARFRPR